ncbi:DNA-binding CsgD family transcriptional regulator [Catenulispora sp. MAP5-51]|uniref:helix-turn-helix transcriptional regulator n=1 Tax=Catenulispora sp. MAP5-51 TaxID=3156298 RepID=UPI0035174A06
MVIEVDGALVGRERDLARLDDFLADIPNGGGSLVILGEAGVGKTALLAAASHRAATAGIRVLSMGTVQYRAPVRHGALRQLLGSSPESRSAAAEKPVLAAVLDPADGRTPSEETVAAAVVEILAELSAAKATSLVLDDAQWLDHVSGTILAQVARALPGTGAAMLCAARTGEGALSGSFSGLEPYPVGPLTETAAEELLTRAFPALSPQVRQRLMATAEGNPLALLELPAALSDTQRIEPGPLPEYLPLTERLQSTFASRIEGLPAPTRHLLLVAALEGSGDLRVIAGAVAGKCDLKHLAPAERARLVRVDDAAGRVAFGHPLMRSAVVALSTSDQRRGVHRALAAAWHDEPGHRAWHLAQAAVEPDESIASLLEEVAELSARRGDGPNAVAALRRAADLSPQGTDRARRLAKTAYVGANLTGQVRDVPQLLARAHRAAPGARSPAEAVATAVYLLNSYGDIDTAHRLLTAAFAALPTPYDTAVATVREAMSALLMTCVHSGRAEQWAVYDAVAEQCTTIPEALWLLRVTFADPARARPGDWARLDAAVAALPGEPDPARIVRIGTAGAYADRLGALEEQLRRTARGGRTGTNSFPAIQAGFLWASHAWSTGQWTELREVVGEGLRLCRELGYPLRSWTGKWVLACLAAVTGDYATARGLADEMELWAGSRRAHAVRCYAAHARTLIALSQNDFERARQHAEVITPTGEFAPFAGHALWAILDQVEAAVRSGRQRQALEHVAAARAAGLHDVSAHLRMILLASAALACADDLESTRGFQESLAVEGAEAWPFDVARIQLYYGERLRRGRAPARARLLLESAAETFTRLGAAPWAERANKELRACGTPVHTTPRPDRGALLTPQQREIAALAAAGLTNKQIAEKLFLSPRTVSSHLYQLFPKLGVTSRAALRDALEPFQPR